MAHKKIHSSRRPNYFTGELLKEEDFKGEQTYHVEMRRRLTNMLHEWGIASGLEVAREGDRRVSISQGVAIDPLGREVILHSGEVVEISEHKPSPVIYLTLSYEEGFEEQDQYPTGDEPNFVRTTEYAVVGVHAGAPPKPEHHSIVLAAIHLDDSGQIKMLDLSVRQYASAKLASGAVKTGELADGSVTEPKLDAVLRALLVARLHGWVRLPFRPGEFTEPGRQGFTIGATKTYCDERGAKGTMGIPVPAGATRIRQFRIAGEKCDGQLSVKLFRCGWNTPAQKHEDTSLLSTTVVGSPFNEIFSVTHDLNAEDHTLGLYVETSNEVSVSLVAAEFEWSLPE